MKTNYFTLLFCLISCFSIAQTPLEIYVSPIGDNSNTGLSSTHPFATLERARDEIRTLNPSSEVTVWLMDGDYNLSNTFELTNQDSGTATHRITYRAVNKHQAKIHLAKQVPASAFQPLTNTNKISRLDPVAVGNVVTLDLDALGVQNMDTWPDYFPANNQELFRLYSGTEELPLSRYPNDSMMTMETVLQNEPGIFKYRGDRHSRWLEAVNDGLWFQGFWRVAWQFDAVRTASIDTTNKIVTQAASVPLGIGDKYTRPQGNGMEPYFATNLIEEIDVPGEWAVNFNNDSLYIWLPIGTTEVRILDDDNPVFKLTNVSYVDIVDIAFDYGLGNAIYIEDGYDNRVAGCDISNFIEDAVYVDNGFSHDIISNDIHHLGAGGIYLSGGDRYTLTHADHTAVNNHIYEFGRVKVIYAPAVQIPRKYDENNVGMYVAHNKIHGTPHVGIEFCGNNNIFEYNEIFDICRVSNDMGGFYTWNDWTSYGNIIRYNYVHSSHQAHGVYMDDGDSGETIYNNIFKGIDVGVFIGGGHDINAYNNLSIDCKKTVHIDNRGVSRGYNLQNTSMVNRVLSVDYQNPPWSVQYPTIVNILDPAYEQELPTNCSIDCNVGINTNTIVDIDATTATSWGVNLGTNHSDTNPSLNTASLSQIAAASAYAGETCIGTIPYTQIGLIDDDYRLLCVDTTVVDTHILTNYIDGTHLQQASNAIEATNTLQAPVDMTYRAGNFICLNHHFEVDLGSEFLAEIRDICPTTTTFDAPVQSRLKFSLPYQNIKKTIYSEIVFNKKGEQFLFYDLSKTQKVSIIITNEKGERVLIPKQDHKENRGRHEICLSDLNLQKGQYYYTIEMVSGGATKPFFVD